MMQRAMFLALMILALLPGGRLTSDEQVELKISNVSITPLPKGVSGSIIELEMSRAYHFEVKIERGGPGQLSGSQCFTVRTECLRGSSRVTLGESRVCLTSGSGWVIYAAYDVFPSSAGAGECLLRTTVDVDNEIQEQDESPASNVWDRKASIVR